MVCGLPLRTILFSGFSDDAKRTAIIVASGCCRSPQRPPRDSPHHSEARFFFFGLACSWESVRTRPSPVFSCFVSCFRHGAVRSACNTYRTRRSQRCSAPEAALSGGRLDGTTLSDHPARDQISLKNRENSCQTLPHLSGRPPSLRRPLGHMYDLLTVQTKIPIEDCSDGFDGAD